jgi:choice-of-anchor A domain-containing protein
VKGTVFAPHAALDFDNGAIDGQVVVASITGTGEFHDHAFTGDLCP